MGTPSRLVTQGPGKIISRALGPFPLSENMAHLKPELHQRFLLTPSQALIPWCIRESKFAQTTWSGEGRRPREGLLTTRQIFPDCASRIGVQVWGTGADIWHHQPRRVHQRPSRSTICHMGSGSSAMMLGAVRQLLQGTEFKTRGGSSRVPAPGLDAPFSLQLGPAGAWLSVDFRQSRILVPQREQIPRLAFSFAWREDLPSVPPSPPPPPL